MISSKSLQLSDDGITKKYSLDKLYLRPFGSTQSDLDIDFNYLNRPKLITALLANCITEENGGIIDPDFFDDLSVGKRIEALFAVATFGGNYPVALEFKCLNSDCREIMEMGLEHSDISNLQKIADLQKAVEIEFDDKKITVRKPTGKDQQNWLKSSYPDNRHITKEIMKSLIQGFEEQDIDDVDDHMTSKIKQAMEESDPLINFGFNTVCPYCDVENYYGLALDELCIRELKKIQSDLIALVHRLASHYKWSETEIFAIPHWRRAQYLNLIDRE